MRLTELNPQLHGSVDGGSLGFDCPLGHPHRIIVGISRTPAPHHWLSTGEYPDTLTLTPSILAHEGHVNDDSLNHPDHKAEYDAAAKCGWHGFIETGGIKTV